MDDLGEVINENIKKNFIEGIFTALPAQVVSVAKFQNLQVVDVQPTIGTIDEDGVEHIPQIIYNVPIIMLGGGGSLISVPVSVDDTVLLVFSMKDIASWKKGDGAYKVAETTRLHNINDAIAIPGLYTNNNTLAPDSDDVVIKYKSSEVRLKKSDEVVIKSPKVIVDHTDAIELGKGAASPVVLGDLFKTWLVAHTHGTGTGPSSPPIQAFDDNMLSSTITTK